MSKTPEDVFAVLVREHEPGLSAFVRACVHDGADADDIVQETFVAAWRGFDGYDPERPFAQWLRGIARNKVLAYGRASGVRRQHVHTLPPQAVAAIADEFERLARPARGEAYSDCFAALRDCLAALGRDDRAIVEGAYRERRTCRAIAEQLGCGLEAIKKRLQRARAQLRDCIVSKLGSELVDGRP